MKFIHAQLILRKVPNTTVMGFIRKKKLITGLNFIYEMNNGLDDFVLQCSERNKINTQRQMKCRNKLMIRDVSRRRDYSQCLYSSYSPCSTSFFNIYKKCFRPFPLFHPQHHSPSPPLTSRQPANSVAQCCDRDRHLFQQTDYCLTVVSSPRL